MILTIIIIFGLWNIFWGINYSMYGKHISSGYELYVKTYGENINSCNSSVKKPSYMSFAGNMALSNKDDTLSIIL